MSDLGQILIDSHSGDDRVRNEAETILSQYRDNDFAEFCYALTVELANEQGDPIARQMAGLVLKINLDSKQQDIKEQLWNRWLMVSGEVRDQVKMGLLQTLASATREAAMTAAQVTAKVAAIELENQSWPDLIETLLNNMQTPDAGHKRATLDALGYICENVSVQALEASINTILTAIVQGMQAAEVNNDVRFAATLALNNALEFIVEPFENDAERDYIMTVVCEATQCEDVRVRQAAMECLVKIVQFFYDKMEPYMEALFQLTFEAIRSDPEQSALQAIEFWSTICEEEMYLNDMLVRATREDRRPEAFSSDYITAALEYLVPMLLQTLTRQMDDQDEDTWNISMAAGTCLNLVTKTVSDAVVEHVVPFVTDNVESNDWHFREAAVFAFGSMMEGTSSEELEELINQGLPIFVNLMGDEHILVAETSAWTLGRVCKFHAAVVSPENVDPLVVALTSGLESPARVATNCCWSFNNLAGAFAGTEVLSPYFNVVLPALLDVTERPDWHEASLRTAAYTAINELIQIATADTTDAVFATFRILLDRLEGTLRVNDGNQGDLQGLLCAALQVITQKVGDEMVEFGDTLMELYLGVFQSNQNSVHEEALLAVGALATAIEGNFQKYVPDFISWLLLGLKNYAEYEVCTIAVGVVGDVCRALEKNVLPYCNDIVGILLADLRNPLLHRDVKPAILSCFGDIALAVGGHFEDYLQVCMNVLNEASLLQLDQTNEELREYQNELREHIFEGYTGVIQGLNGDDQAHQLAEYVEHIMQFIDFVYRDPYRDEPVTRGAVGVLGDLAHAMGSDVAHFLAFDFVQPIIRDCSNGEEEESIETANFTRSVVKKLLQRNQGGGKSF